LIGIALLSLCRMAMSFGGLQGLASGHPPYMFYFDTWSANIYGLFQEYAQSFRDHQRRCRFLFLVLRIPFSAANQQQHRQSEYRAKRQ
jgi:hypothetical protein